MKFIRPLSMLTAMIMLFTTLTACSDSKKNDSEAGKTSAVGYVFDDTTEMLKLDSGNYKIFTNRSIKMDYKDTDYKTILSYKSPYADYVGDIYTEAKNGYTLTHTAAYAIIYAYEHNVETIDFPIEFDTDTLNDAWDYACLAYPNIPCSLTRSYYERSDDGLYRLRLTKSVREVASSKETLKAAKEIVDSIPKNYKTDAQKAYYLYDWICKNVVYDSYHAENNIGMANAAPQSAYGALIEKRAVCDGIAGGLQLLFEMAGIDCSKISGYTGKDGVGHVWNTAVIDGEVWDFDATWDIYRYYSDADDTIKEAENTYGGYAWFGYSRALTNKNMIIADVSASFAPDTATDFTEKSPALLSYDFCVNSFDNIFEGQKKLDKTALLSELVKALDKKEQVRILFNNCDDYVGFFVSLMLADSLYDNCRNEELVKSNNSSLLTVVLSKK